MITLQPISHQADLHDYYKFRQRIYSSCKQSAFVDSSSDLDVDHFDPTALHFGWYSDGKLSGCLRFIPGVPDKQLCMHHHMPHSCAVEIDKTLSRWDEFRYKYIEVSRLCLHQDKRNIRSIIELVLCAMAMAMIRNVHHAVIYCASSHARFYQRMGFFPIAGTDHICNKTGRHFKCLKWEYSKLPGNLKHEVAIRILSQVHTKNAA